MKVLHAMALATIVTEGSALAICPTGTHLPDMISGYPVVTLSIGTPSNPVPYAVWGDGSGEDTPEIRASLCALAKQGYAEPMQAIYDEKVASCADGYNGTVTPSGPNPTNNNSCRFESSYPGYLLFAAVDGYDNNYEYYCCVPD